jgi:hypothetical protein
MAYMGVQRPEDGNIIHQVYRAQNSQHQEPHTHHGAKQSADGGGAKLLGKKEKRQYAQNDIYNYVLGQIFERRDVPQPFNGRSDGNGRCNNAIRQKGRPANHGRYHQPFFPPPNQRKQGKYASFTPVIGAQYQYYVFNGGLKGNRPNDEGERS